jgi:hypothetical protein
MTVLNRPRTRARSLDSPRFLRVPQGFDPSAIMRGESKSCVALMALAMSKATMGPVYDSRTRKERHGWHPIRCEVMEQLEGRHGTWGQARKRLIESGSLECDEEYRPGVKSKWYRPGPEWIGRDTEGWPLTDQKFARRLAKIEAEQTERYEKRQPVHGFMTLCLGEMTIDEEVARPYTSNPRSTAHRYNRMAVEAIKNAEWRQTVCPYGRFHTNITSLSRKIRSALRWNGIALTEIDVVSAQPLIIGAMAAGWTKGRTTTDDIKEAGNKAGKPPTHPCHHHQTQRTPTLCTPIQQKFNNPTDLLLPVVDRSQLPPDLKDYLDVCEAGDFYEVLASLWGLNADDRAQRSRLKRMTFKLILFGLTRPGHRKWLAFRKKWPTVADFLKQAKAPIHSPLPRAEKCYCYGVPARVCQRLESALMIGGVATRLMTEHPDTPIWTIHDAVLIAPHAVGVVERTIREVWACYGLWPKLKRKPA